MHLAATTPIVIVLLLGPKMHNPELGPKKQNPELIRLALDIYLMKGVLIIAPCDKTNALAFHQFEELEEILRSMKSELILQYDTSLR